jgi:hypothetical protein
MSCEWNSRRPALIPARPCGPAPVFQKQESGCFKTQVRFERGASQPFTKMSASDSLNFDAQSPSHMPINTGLPLLSINGSRRFSFGTQTLGTSRCSAPRSRVFVYSDKETHRFPPCGFGALQANPGRP